MSGRYPVPRRAAAALAGAWLWFALGQTAIAQTLPADGEFVYHTRARDTLIGLCRALLTQPQRWRAVQTLNHIPDPRRMATGTPLRIPYSWLKLVPEDAIVAQVSGRASSAGANLLPGQTLPQGSDIETGPDGSITLNLADGSVITLQKSSTLRLDEMQRVAGVQAAHDLRLKLQSGRAQMVVKPHRDVGRFEIVTPVAISAVRGTVFRSGYNADGNDATTETLSGAVGVGGQLGNVSVSEGFGTRVNRNESPEVPVPLLPPPGLAAVPPRATDPILRVQLTPVAGARAYRVQLATDANFYALAADEVSDTPLLSIAGLADGAYWLRARAIDPADIEGTDAVTTLIRHLLPAAPAPVAAAAATPATGGQAQFAWLPVAAAAHYQLQVAHDQGFTDLAIERPQVEATQITENLADGHYFWRVASVEASGERGAWSDVRSVIVLPDPPVPEVPVVDRHLLSLHWSTRPGERYRVQVARNSEFTRILTDQSVDQGTLVIKRPYPGIYFARVQILGEDAVPERFGPARRFEVPVPRWVKVLLPLLAIATLLR